MADDAGALLVRSGLITAKALDAARARAAKHGGTLGEHLVAQGAIGDDALTEFYRSRLLVPQVNPNSLAKLKTRVVEAIPPDMAVELRAVPVAFDADGNLMVAMGDPSDRHAVDEITFFTGNYVVRAVATQMQIAWCLAHYYGHVTELGQRLLQPKDDAVPEPAPAVTPASSSPGIEVTRQRGDTARVEAARHRVLPPVDAAPEPAVAARPTSDVLDRSKPGPSPAPAAAAPVEAAAEPATEAPSETATEAVKRARAQSEADAILAVESIEASEAIRVATPDGTDDDDDDDDEDEDDDDDDDEVEIEAKSGEPDDAEPKPKVEAEAAADAKRDSAPKADAVPVATDEAKLSPGGRSRTASGEISVPKAVTPELSEPEMEITIHAEEPTSPGMRLPRKRRSDPPPELADRGGEIAAREDSQKSVTEEHSIVVDLEILAPERQKPFEASGEIPLPRTRATSARMAAIPAQRQSEPSIRVELDDAPAVIHDSRKSIESIIEEQEDDFAEESAPILLERPRTAPPVADKATAETATAAPKAAPEGPEAPDGDGAVDESEVVLLETTRRPRTTSERRQARRTQLGLGAVGHGERAARDTEVGGLPPGADAVASQVIIIAPEAGTVVSPAAGDQTIVTNAVPEYALDDDDDDEDDEDGVAAPPAADDSAIPDAKASDDNTTRTEEMPAIPGPQPAAAKAAPVLARITPVKMPASSLKPAVTADAKQESKVESRPGPKPESTPEPKVEAKPEPAAEPKLEAKPEPKPASTVETTRPESEPEAEDVTKPVELADPTRRYEPKDAKTKTDVGAKDDDDDDGRSTHPYDAIAEPPPPPPKPVEHDSVDDGWGPPGTTIPPPLLAAVDDSAPFARIPIADDDSAPLMVAPPIRPTSPSTSPADAAAFAKDLETAATRLVQVLRDIDQAPSRNKVIYNLIAHLAETHNRAAFFAVKAGELSVFTVRAPKVLQPRLSMKLDDPSSFQDAIGTRLPYRGPVVDEPTRQFLLGLLGSAPAEMLLIPVAVRDRVVGVLYADGRRRHTFDDHYAIAARAAGLALERILKTKK